MGHDIADLLGAEVGQDGHAYEARRRDAEVGHRPLRPVLGQESDLIALFIAVGAQPQGQPGRRGAELPVGRGLAAHETHRGPVGIALGALHDHFPQGKRV